MTRRLSTSAWDRPSLPLDDRDDDTPPSDLMRCESTRAEAARGAPVYHLSVISGSDIRLLLLIVTILFCMGTSAIAGNSRAPESRKVGSE